MTPIFSLSWLMKIAMVPERLKEPEGLLAVVGLGEVEVLQVDADGLGVGRVEGVLGVYEGGEAAGPLGLGDDVQGEGGLAAGLGAVDLDDAAPGDAAHAEGHVEGEGAGGDGGDPPRPAVAHAHDRALAELSLHLRNGGVYRPMPVVRHPKIAHKAPSSFFRVSRAPSAHLARDFPAEGRLSLRRIL